MSNVEDEYVSIGNGRKAGVGKKLHYNKGVCVEIKLIYCMHTNWIVPYFVACIFLSL